MLKKDDRDQQMVYYQVDILLMYTSGISILKNLSKAGIGTYTIPQIATPAYAKFSKMVDMAVAQNLDAHVMGMYATSLPCY